MYGRDSRESFDGDDEWLDDVDSPNVLWLTGCPGAGKSTIASSLISRLTERGRLGSHFFFKRGDITLSDPTAVWRTVAYDLALFSPIFAENLVEMLKGRTILHKRPDVALHFKFLVEIPLNKSYDHSSTHPIPVVVINALDEYNLEGPQGGVLYTHPRVSMESMKTLWSSQRVSMDSMRTPRRLHGDSM